MWSNERTYHDPGGDGSGGDGAEYGAVLTNCARRGVHLAEIATVMRFICKGGKPFPAKDGVALLSDHTLCFALHRINMSGALVQRVQASRIGGNGLW